MTHALLDIEITSSEELRRHLAGLSDLALERLRLAVLPAPRDIDVFEAVQLEQTARRRLQRDADQLPITLQAMAERLTGHEDITQLSEAEQIALLTYKPDCLAARQLEARARGLPLPQGGNLPRRRLSLEPERSPDTSVSKPGATLPAPSQQNAPTATPRAAASNVIPLDLFLPKVTGTGTGKPVIYHQGEG